MRFSGRQIGSHQAVPGHNLYDEDVLTEMCAWGAIKHNFSTRKDSDLAGPAFHAHSTLSYYAWVPSSVIRPPVNQA